jgi:hypothetical protein
MAANDTVGVPYQPALQRLITNAKVERIGHLKSTQASVESEHTLSAGPSTRIFIAPCDADPAPQRPALTIEMQFGSGPKFLLLSSAPASGGFMAEAVGTCQGSPLRFDR